MTLDELKTALDASGLPFVYHHWETEKKPPYGVYLYAYDAPFYADGVVFYSGGHYQVELYVRKKDPDAETSVEKALSTAGIAYVKSELYLDSEGLYEILYEIEV